MAEAHNQVQTGRGAQSTSLLCAMSRSSRALGTKDLPMLEGVSSQRIDGGYNAFSSSLMHQDRLTQIFVRGNPEAVSIADTMNGFRSEATSTIGNAKPYCDERDNQYVQNSRDFDGVLGSVERQDLVVDVNGCSQVSNLINNSGRLAEWNRPREGGESLGSGQVYRRAEEGDDDSSSSSTGASVEEDADGDMGEEGEEQEEVAGFVNDGMPDHKVYGNLSTIEIGAIDGAHEPAGPIFMRHPDESPLAQNGAMLMSNGIEPSSRYFRDGMTVKDTSTSMDSYGKDGHTYIHGPGIGTSCMADVAEVVSIGVKGEECRGSHFHTPASILQGDTGNQIVAFNYRRNYESMEMSLQSALTDPLTGALMDDAMILICGHSFGNDSLQRVLENNACISCGAAARREDMAPNHALRMVVQAYRREMEIWNVKSAKRKRDRLEQARHTSGDFASAEFSRPRGVQFPYKVNDKVLIKGNKRTPERFVGRSAIITTQCLNGWYVVRSLDNGETVKLQYRSLMKIDE